MTRGVLFNARILLRLMLNPGTDEIPECNRMRNMLVVINKQLKQASKITSDPKC